jgi:hypothetical protein
VSAADSLVRYIDFHLHTNHSDGAGPPARVVERAAEFGMSAMAITDHDTLSGIPEARAAAEQAGIEFLNGTEISSQIHRQETHILGLGISLECDALNNALETQAQQRADRALRIIERLRNLGVPIEMERIEARAAGGSIGRMHIAQEILSLGHSTSVQDAFDKFIKAGRPAHVPKAVLPCAEALDLIHEAGGLAFAAHPGIGNRGSRVLGQLLKNPFDGIEAYHSRHTDEQAATFRALARDRNLLVTGGSDCHGAIKGEAPLMGSVQVPYECYERILDALN